MCWGVKPLTSPLTPSRASSSLTCPRWKDAAQRQVKSAVKIVILESESSGFCSLLCGLRQVTLFLSCLPGEMRISVLTLLDLVLKALVAQLCPTPFDPMDCGPPGSSVCSWDSPGKDTGVSRNSLLQGIFQTHGSSPGLLHCRRILYHLSH